MKMEKKKKLNHLTSLSYFRIHSSRIIFSPLNSIFSHLCSLENEKKKIVGGSKEEKRGFSLRP